MVDTQECTTWDFQVGLMAYDVAACTSLSVLGDACVLCRLANMTRLAHRGIATARSTMHVAAGPDVLRLSPNSVVLDRLGLLEPQAMAYIDRMAARVSLALHQTHQQCRQLGCHVVNMAVSYVSLHWCAGHAGKGKGTVMGLLPRGIPWQHLTAAFTRLATITLLCCVSASLTMQDVRRDRRAVQLTPQEKSIDNTARRWDTRFHMIHPDKTQHNCYVAGLVGSSKKAIPKVASILT